MDHSILLPLLLFLHFIGDFSLQKDTWIKEKEEKHFKSISLLYHILVHTGLTLVVILLFDYTQFYLAFVLGAIHWLIDGAKSYLNKKGKWGVYLFLIDQLLHVATIIIIHFILVNEFSNFSSFQDDVSILLEKIFTYQNIIILMAYYITYVPMSFLLQKITHKWQKELTEARGLKSAGKWIGRLERILILTFILIGQFGAIGFLLGAKSIFRFGNLNEADNQKQTEYIVIGTLSSFTTTILLGLLIKSLIA